MNGEERWQSAGSLERFNAGEMFAGSVDGYLHLSNGKMGDIERFFWFFDSCVQEPRNSFS